jgi:hypothetical protein
MTASPDLAAGEGPKISKTTPCKVARRSPASATARKHFDTSGKSPALLHHRAIVRRPSPCLAAGCSARLQADIPDVPALTIAPVIPGPAQQELRCAIARRRISRASPLDSQVRNCAPWFAPRGAPSDAQCASGNDGDTKRQDHTTNSQLKLHRPARAKRSPLALLSRARKSASPWSGVTVVGVGLSAGSVHLAPLAAGLSHLERKQTHSHSAAILRDARLEAGSSG